MCGAEQHQGGHAMTYTDTVLQEHKNCRHYMTRCRYNGWTGKWQHAGCIIYE